MKNRGHFEKGADSRRHRSTRDECGKGFWVAIESIVSRHPEAVMKDGRHIAVNYLNSKRPTQAAT